MNFHLEKDDEHYPVKDFPKIVSNFLKQDVFKNKENIESLMENLLLLETVDSEFPHNNKLLVNMQDQTVSNKFKMDRSLHRYLTLGMLTNPAKVTHKKPKEF